MEAVQPAAVHAESSRVGRPRDAYADVGAALRASIVQAIAEGGLNRLSRVYLAVLYLTASYSRLREPRVYVAQIADIACVDETVARKELNRLHRLGVLNWTPSRGRGKASAVGLPGSDLKNRPLLTRFSSENLSDRGRKTGSLSTEKPVRSDPPTEKLFREGLSEERAEENGKKHEQLRCFVCDAATAEGEWYGGQWFCLSHRQARAS